MTNEALNPNSFLKAHFTDTFLCPDNVNFNDTVNNNANCISGLFAKNATDYDAPVTLQIPMFIKRINVRVFNPETVAYPEKFIAGYNLMQTLYGTPSLNPRIFLLEGSEIEIYGRTEINKLRMFVGLAGNPFLLQIALFK